MGHAQPKRQRNRRQGSRRQTGASRGLPGWAMLTIGLIIGLFVAFLVYLDDLDSPPASAVESQPAGEEGTTTGETETAAAEEDDDGSPRFEFYSILPELEVVVPDASDEGSAPAVEGAPGSPADSGEADTGTAPPPESDGRYYLQAGSFQKAEQADRMKARISLLGLDVEIQKVDINGEQWHRVRAGPFTDATRLKDAQKRLRGDDIDYLVTRDKSSG
ncbi:MAG: SPOR domain-containing protein [Halofilum sp. (in: g-proteobacteria)]